MRAQNTALRSLLRGVGYLKERLDLREEMLNPYDVLFA